MKCSNCGIEIPAGTKFCTKCGLPISQNTAHTFVWKDYYTYIAIGVAIVFAAIIGLLVKSFMSTDTIKNNSDIVAEDIVKDNTDFSNRDITQDSEDIPEPHEPENSMAADGSVQRLDDIENIMEAEYILPGSESRYLSKSDLEGLSSEECRLARNELYAHHGRRFIDKELQAYFDSKEWYVGVIEASDFKEDMLNDYEVYNRDLILEYEEEMGYR